MKGPWKVTSNVINGKTMYGVYRLLDVSGVDHSGNREHYGNYLESRDKAAEIAKDLNRMEEEV